jgi:hypothetical protein
MVPQPGLEEGYGVNRATEARGGEGLPINRIRATRGFRRMDLELAPGWDQEKGSLSSEVSLEW